LFVDITGKHLPSCDRERSDEMPNTIEQCVVVADAARARLFALDIDDENGTSHLRELGSLEDPERRQLQSERYSDTRPGVERGHLGGQAHGVDDRRDRHDRELDRRFAGQITRRVKEVARGARSIVLVASSRMVSTLVTELEAIPGTELRHVVADVVDLRPAQIHDYLAARGLVRERGRAGRPASA
jgi:hypothetical protein